MHRQPLCAARSPGIMVCLRRAAAHETRKLRVLSVLCFFVHELYNIFEPAESLLTSCPLLFLLLEILIARWRTGLSMRLTLRALPEKERA